MTYDKYQLLQQMTSARHRSVAKIIFWLHGHIPRGHSIHVIYNFEHYSSWLAAQWGVCVVIDDVRHTVKTYFSTSVQKLLTLSFSPFAQTWFTICPSKKMHISFCFFPPTHSVHFPCTPFGTLTCVCVVCLFCLFNSGILCQGFPFLCVYFNMHISMRPSYLERPLFEISPDISAHLHGAESSLKPAGLWICFSAWPDHFSANTALRNFTVWPSL